MISYKLIPIALIFILGACVGNEWAEDWQEGNPKPWTRGEKTMAGTYIAGQIINYFQIEFIMKHDEWTENNQWINEIHKEFGMEGIAIWKTGTTAIILTAANNLPKWRKWILGGANTFTWGWVITDDYRGVEFSMRFF